MLAPNIWNPAKQTLNTVVTFDENRAIGITIRQLPQGRVAAHSLAKLSRCESSVIRQAVTRILRLKEDLSPLHDLCRRHPSHSEAASLRFGRLLRSATLFEDVIKVICTCNVAWPQTVAMIDQIVRHWGVPCDGTDMKGFPTPKQLAHAGITALKKYARVGYRAEYIHDFATNVASGALQLASLEQNDLSSDELYKRLCKIRGVGDYAASNLCMLLGHYDRLAIDTELIRLLTRRHPRKRFTPASIRTYYQRWQPYAFLAYWYELWSDYVDRHGRPEDWSPMGVGRKITARKPWR